MIQEELSKKIGVSPQAIGNYETGRRIPRYTTLKTIADLFNVDMDYLNGRSPIKNKYALLEEKETLMDLTIITKKAKT